MAKYKVMHIHPSVTKLLDLSEGIFPHPVSSHNRYYVNKLTSKIIFQQAVVRMCCVRKIIKYIVTLANL